MRLNGDPLRLRLLHTAVEKGINDRVVTLPELGATLVLGQKLPGVLRCLLLLTVGQQILDRVDVVQNVVPDAAVSLIL